MLALLIAQDTAGVKGTGEAQWHVFGDYFFANSLFLVLAPIAIVFLIYGRARIGRDASRVSALPNRDLPASFVQRIGWIPLVMQTLAAVLLSISLARP